MPEQGRQHEFFVGIDSDGCVFDTMELKHKECFIPLMIHYYGLQGVSKYAREAAEFVNLYSKSRGINRFLALIEQLDWLRDRPEVVARQVEVPAVESVRDWTQRETKLGNPTLAAEVEATGDADLRRALQWSEEVNQNIERFVHQVPPFPCVRESLERLVPIADMLVVSATPNAALVAEWEEHDVRKYVLEICGQEAGSKRETLARGNEYAADHRLMIGDAPGDYKAAAANECLFFPIVPGREEESWRAFLQEGIDRFVDGRFAGAYQQALLEEFDSVLPAEPPWQRSHVAE